MRKKCRILFVLALMFFMTGCVKFNANMDIRKDKSMDFKIIYAVDTIFFGETELLKAEDKENLINSGFIVDNYEEGNMKGVSISREIKNIDLVSASEDTKYSLSSIFETETASSALFKVKKGLFKNVYTADLTFDSNDSSLSGDSDTELDECDPELEDCTEMGESNLDEDGVLEEDIELDEDVTLEDDTATEEDEDMDFSGLDSAMESMDMSFNVTLPYAAISNNATEVTNEGKNLRWELTAEDVASMQFQFALYNMTTIYIVIGVGVLLLLVIILFIVKKMKGSKKKESVPNQTANIEPVQFNGMNNMLSNNTMNMVQGNALFPQPEVSNNGMMQNNVSEVNNVIPQENSVMASQSNVINTQVNNNMSMNNVEQNNAMFPQSEVSNGMIQNNVSEVNNVQQTNNNMGQNNVVIPQPINPQPIISNNMSVNNNVVQSNNDVAQSQPNVVNYGGMSFVQGTSNPDTTNNQNMN